MLPTSLPVGVFALGRDELRSSFDRSCADAAEECIPVDQDAVHRQPQDMKLVTATIAGLALLAASFGLLWAADEAKDAAAIAGGTGLIIGGALLGLTFLSWWWRSAQVAYVSTSVDSAGFYEELAAFDAGDEPAYDDAAAI